MPISHISEGHGRSLRYSPPHQRIAMVLALVATVIGLGWLALVLGSLFWQGFTGLSLAFSRR